MFWDDLQVHSGMSDTMKGWYMWLMQRCTLPSSELSEKNNNSLIFRKWPPQFVRISLLSFGGVDSGAWRNFGWWFSAFNPNVEMVKEKWKQWGRCNRIIKTSFITVWSELYSPQLTTPLTKKQPSDKKLCGSLCVGKKLNLRARLLLQVTSPRGLPMEYANENRQVGKLWTVISFAVHRSKRMLLREYSVTKSQAKNGAWCNENWDLWNAVLSGVAMWV